MSSLQLPTAIFAADSDAALVAAIGDVAGRCFFSFAEACEPGRFAELVVGTGRWFSASVEFEEGDCAGRVRCLLPEELASLMFDAFSGRGPADAAPSSADVSDLMAEFANMVCEAWLTRAASRQTFTLRAQPTSVSYACAPVAGESWTTLAVNDRPVAIAVRIAVPAEPVGV